MHQDKDVMVMLALASLFFIGIAAAIFGSIVGLGGGIIIVPALMYFSPSFMGESVGHEIAVGTSLAVLIFTALTSTLQYHKQQRIDYPTGWLLFATSGPSAMLGATMTGAIPQGPFQLSFGIFMLLMAILLKLRESMKPLKLDWPIKKTALDKEGHEVQYGYSLTWMLVIGVAVGFVSGLFGIGGGSLFVPAMILFFRFPAHLATATSMFVILLSAVLGSTVHIALGDVEWYYVAALAPGALLGGWIGAYIANKLSSKALIWLLWLTLVVFALRFISSGVLG